MAIPLTVARVARILSNDDLTEQVIHSVTPELLRVADGHWVAPLVAHRLRQAGAEGVVDARTAEMLRQQLCFEAAFELAVTCEIRKIVDECAREGIPTFLMKGAALAYTHYAAPHLRPRVDTDVLIHARDREPVAGVLTRLGYAQSSAASGSITVHQTQFVRPIAGGLPHAIDVHWKAFNPVVFSDLLTVDEIAAASVPVPGIAASARTLCPIHALVQLAVHRVAHHEPGLNLLGLYDIHLVASGLSDGDWAGLIEISEERRLAEILAQSVALAADLFATPLPRPAATWIRRCAGRAVPQAFAPFMREGRRVIDVIASDFGASRGWGRASVLREHLFPPSSYMRAQYGTDRRWLLPYLYVRRVVSGVPRVLRRGRYS